MYLQVSIFFKCDKFTRGNPEILLDNIYIPYICLKTLSFKNLFVKYCAEHLTQYRVKESLWLEHHDKFLSRNKMNHQLNPKWMLHNFTNDTIVIKVSNSSRMHITTDTIIL